MRQTMLIAAGETGKFASGSWDSQIGKTVPFKVEGCHVADATVISAGVAEDGSSVTLTVEIPDPPGTDVSTEAAAGQLSFAFAAQPKPSWMR